MKVSDMEALLDIDGTIKKIVDKVRKHQEILNVTSTHVIHGPYALVVKNSAIRLFCPVESTVGLFVLAPVTHWEDIRPNLYPMPKYLSNLPPKEIVTALERWEGIEAWLDSLVTLAKEQKEAGAAAEPGPEAQRVRRERVLP